MNKELAKTMKDPDFIYVSIDTPMEKRRNPEFVGLAWAEKDNSCEHVEYIRKDALIERIKERLKLYDPDDPEDETVCYELQSIIRFLNEKEENNEHD